jgi:two-component system, LytTR family, sensor kinase
MSDPFPLRFRPRPLWLLLGLLYCTADGLLRFGYERFDALARERREPWLEPFIEELTGAYGAGLLVLLVIPFALRFRFGRVRPWPRVLFAHLVGAMVFSLLHTSWMALTRQVAFPLFGLGRYDYGLLGYRYPMEAFNDLFHYAVAVTLVHLVAGAIESRRRERELATLQSQLQAARLENYRMQVQPHFLFNALNAISNLVYRDPAAADRMLARLADLLRLTLEQVGQRHPLARELQIVDGYLEMMALRYPDRLRWRIDEDPALRGVEVPSLILQPLVENAVRHAVERSDRPTEIAISARRIAADRAGDLLSLCVADDGPGLERERATPGVGWTTTTERLASLHGEQASFMASSGPNGGAVVEVRMPISPQPPQEERVPEPSLVAAGARAAG